ncbi:MAG: hypothetical protein ACODAD_12000 [Planctomycetota bacterium]
MIHSAGSDKTFRPGRARGQRRFPFASFAIPWAMIPWATIRWAILEGAGHGLSLVVQGITLAALLLAGSAALLIGISKTGIPGVSMPAIALMAEAFPNNTQHSVGAMVPLLVFGDLFAHGIVSC